MSKVPAVYGSISNRPDVTDITDTQRLQFLISALEWDGYGYWLPEWCMKPSPQPQRDPCPEPTLKEFRVELDRRRTELDGRMRGEI
jgi:hypothetical protein